MILGWQLSNLPLGGMDKIRNCQPSIFFHIYELCAFYNNWDFILFAVTLRMC